ncbi:MAG: Rpn family recombination-promoting nuclease/putative transposase, partial [Chitinispirillales bacterium]|nr:Rpn family recombination-promoting nuclease/putative transposase [Chitinispirillales bacterium]
AKIEKTTLKNVFIGKWRNDLSFLIDNRLIVLIEHQSTINENMPMRMLQYICETYNKLFKKEDLYAETKKFIPKPVFIVLYNGEKDMEKDYCEYRLSDMFLGFDGSKETPDLELTVYVYNINKGHNAEMVVRSRILNGYVTLIAEIRENKKTMGLDDAIEKAIEDCLKKDILTDFLNKHKEEIKIMLVAEWDFDLEKKVLKQESWQGGREEGQKETLQKNVRRMYQKGYDVEAIADALDLSNDDVIGILGL